MSVELVLIGPPGSGKSSVAKSLAKKTGKRYVDTDKVIEEREGKPITEIFLEDGEEHFRTVESEVVLQTLEGEDEIVALGGGSILSEVVREELKKFSPIIYLEVSISNAAPRVGFNRERPLLLGNPRAQWLALMEIRRPIYESLATFKVSTDNKKPDQVTSEILELVKL